MDALHWHQMCQQEFYSLWAGEIIQWIEFCLACSQPGFDPWYPIWSLNIIKSYF